MYSQTISDNILEVRGLCKHYPEFSLKDVSFSIPKGYIMGFIGPNGAGKTTTIKSILNMVYPDTGEIRLFGSPFSEADEKTKNEIGVVMDLAFFSDEWTLTDLEKVVSPFYTNWDHTLYMELCAKFRLSPKKKVKELSRGMKVKLMLTMALSHHPKLLLLDEPTSGLDPVARDEMMDILQNFISNENNGVLFSTHITSDLEKVADYITFILDGQIRFTGEKDQLMENYHIIRGGLSDLTRDQKRLIIGYRETGVGFEGMIPTDLLNKLPRNIITDKLTLDEFIVFMNMEGNQNE